MIIYVDSAASKAGNGSKEMPYKQINDAAQAARAGDEILVNPGVYRESVNPRNGGEENARITYRSVKLHGAVITGAEEVKTWKRYQDKVWVCRINNGVFGDYNPYTTLVYGDWYFAQPTCHTGAVYLNGRQLYETTSLEECINGEIYTPSWEPQYSIYKWYTKQEESETVIYANFQGADPNEEQVEINVRRNCFMPSETGKSYITISGFDINKAATTWAPPAAYQDGMIGPHWSKGWIIEDCEISNSKCSGISLGKYLDPENDHYFSEVKEDMGFMMADNQVVGSGIFDEYPTYDEWIKCFDMDSPYPNMFKLQDYHFAHLPVWVNGNAYFNGAKNWKNEKNSFADDGHKIYAELEVKNGEYKLKTNVYEYLGDFKTGIINSDILGEAFEPEERFENPDGTSITFTSDYFGNHRGIDTIPGPFATAEGAKEIMERHSL